MKASERIAPLLAIVSSLGTLACCLPLGFVAALGTAGAAVYLISLRPWLLGISLVSLGVGFVQLYRKGGSCAKRSLVSVVLLWTAASIVLFVFLFPQLIATLLAS